MTAADGITVDRQPPEEAFAVLANDLRVDILQALGDADDPLTFSELRTTVDVRDSGKFNYHLGKLVGHFVVHDEEGYRLSLAGKGIYGAIVSGTYTTDAAVDPFEFHGPCPICGHPDLLAEYADERARMYCPDCEDWMNEFPFPPGTLEQFTREELPYAFDRWMQATIAKVVRGFCSNCGGRVDGKLQESQDQQFAMPVRAEYTCGRCGEVVQAYAGLPLQFHPIAIEFFADHGVDVLSDPTWRYFDAADTIDITVATEDPLTARVEIVIEGDSLVVTVDPDATIDSIEVSQEATP